MTHRTHRTHCEFSTHLADTISILSKMGAPESPGDGCSTFEEIKNRDRNLFESMDSFERVGLILKSEAENFEAAGLLTGLDRLQMDRLGELIDAVSWQILLALSENPRPN